MAYDTQHLEERLAALEDIQKRSVGDHAPKVCHSCYAIQDVGGADPDSCLCKLTSWTLLEVGIASIRIRLDDLYTIQRRSRLAS